MSQKGQKVKSHKKKGCHLFPYDERSQQMHKKHAHLFPILYCFCGSVPRRKRWYDFAIPMEKENPPFIYESLPILDGGITYAPNYITFSSAL